MTTNDDMTAPELAPVEQETAAESVTEAPPALDMGAVENASDAHTAAVTTAHENLRTRMEAAYAEFSTELDRAYRVWEDAVSVAKAIAPVIPQVSEVIHEPPDATRAR